MTHSLKRILSMTLALCLCLTLLPTLILKTKAASLSQSEFEDKLSGATSMYPTGSQQDYWYVNGSYIGRQCHGYGRWISWYVWGTDFANGKGTGWTLLKSTSSSSYIDSLAPGDVVRFRRKNKSWNHTIFITSIVGDTIYYTDCNSDGACTIKWGQQVSKATLDSWLKLTLYNYSNETATYGYIAHYSSNTLGSSSASTPHTCNKGTYMYYEAAHPHYKWYTCSVCGEAWRNTAETTYVSTCETCAPKRTIDSRYSGFSPFLAYPVATSGQISVYDESGTKYSNRYIDAATDFCYVLEVYTDGWCKVKYPSSAESSGYFYAYVPLSTFTDSDSVSTWTVPRDYTAYLRYGLSQEWPGYFGSVTNGSKCLLLEADGYDRQIVYPISYNGETCYVMGWVKNDKKIHVSTDCVNLTVGGTDTQTIYLWTSGQYNGSTSVYFGQNDATNYSCTFGSWSNGKLPLTIKAYSSGTSKLTIGVKDSESDAVLNSTNLTVTITAKSYTIKYNANGGSGAPASQTKTHGTALTLSSVKPTRSGYTFLGWSTSSTATSASYNAGGSFTANANTTLYAVWKQDKNEIVASTTTVELCHGDIESVTIDFAPSGSSNVSFGFDTNDSRAIGCTWGDWKNNSLPLTITAKGFGKATVTVTMYDSSTDKALDSVDISVNVTSKAYVVQYDANGGSGAPSKCMKVHIQAMPLSTTVPTRSGYTFLGWATSKNATSAEYQPGDDFSINADTTLYAVWKQLGVAEYKYVKPDKTTYQIGEKLDLTGFKLTLTYTDGTTNTITDGFSISGFDSSSEGERQFKVTYTDGRNLICVYITYTIENPIVTREIISFPTKTVYEIGDSLDTTGLKFMLTYADGTSLTLWGAFTTSGFSSTSAGEKEVKVFYNGELVGTFTVTVKAPQSTSAKISMTSETAKAGDTVSIAVNLDSNPGIAGATFSVNYDDVLTLESVDDKSVLPGTMIAGQVGTKPYTMLWYGSNDSTKTGCFVILNFRVADNAKEGSYNVSISCSDASNEKGADVTIPSTSAVVTVKSARLPGDVNGDGKVSIKDSVRLAQYLAGWSVTIQSDNADVNGDGKISIKDSVRLAQYLAGWNVVLK